MLRYGKHVFAWFGVEVAWDVFVVGQLILVKVVVVEVVKDRRRDRLLVKRFGYHEWMRMGLLVKWFGYHKWMRVGLLVNQLWLS